MAEKRSFEGKCEILRTISQPRTLSADIPGSQEGVCLFYNPPINFHLAIQPLVNMVKNTGCDLMANARDRREGAK